MYDISIFIMEFKICIIYGVFVYMFFLLWIVGRDISIGRLFVIFVVYIKFI